MIQGIGHFGQIDFGINPCPAGSLINRVWDPFCLTLDVYSMSIPELVVWTSFAVNRKIFSTCCTDDHFRRVQDGLEPKCLVASSDHKRSLDNYLRYRKLHCTHLKYRWDVSYRRCPCVEQESYFSYLNIPIILQDCHILNWFHRWSPLPTAGSPFILLTPNIHIPFLSLPIAVPFVPLVVHFNFFFLTTVLFPVTVHFSTSK